MKKHFKIKSIAMICTLAVAGIFGISSAVINKQTLDSGIVKKAEANTNVTVYCVIPDSTISAKGANTVKLNTKADGRSGEGWSQSNMTKTSATYKGTPVYSGSFNAPNDTVWNIQFQLYNGSTWKYQYEPVAGSYSVSLYNGKLIEFDDSSKTWKTYNPDTKANVTLYLDAGPKTFGGTDKPWAGYNEYGDVSDSSSTWTGMTRLTRDGAGTLNFWSVSFSNVVTNQGLKFRINNTSLGFNTGNFSYDSGKNTYYWNGSSLSSYSGDGSIHQITKYEKMGSNSPTQLGNPSYLLDGINYEVPTHTSHLGYDFSKWNTEADGTGTTYNDNQYVAFHDDTVLYALFNSSTWNIVFWKGSANYAYVWETGGGDYIKWHGAAGSSITIDENEYWYYSFPSNYNNVIINDNDSWEKNIGYSTSAADGKYFDLTEDGWFELSVRLHKKDKNNVAYSGSDAANTTFPYNKTTTLTGTKAGYTATWHLKADCSDDPITELSAYMYLTETTVYAEWTPKTSALTFNLNGGSGTAPTGKTATYGSAMPTYGASAPTKTGYTFGGFYDESGGTGTQYYTNALASARTWNKDTTSGTTLYAKWTAHTFTIAYNNNTGSGTMTSTTGVTYNTANTLKTSTFTKAGHTFKEWNTQADGKGASYNPGSVSALQVNELYPGANGGTRTLYAIWTSGEAAAITFATNFNSAIGSICTSYNTNTKSSFLTNWNGTQEAAYNALEDYQLYWLVVGRSSNEEIIEMIGNGSTIKGKYDYVLTKYGYGAGDSNLHDFMGRTPSKSAISNFTPYDLFGSEDGMSTAIIIISSSIALLSITALSILVIKKRKSKEQE